MLYLFTLFSIFFLVALLWQLSPSNSDERKVRAQAIKHLGSVVSAEYYCQVKNMTMAELENRIAKQQIKAYQAGRFLFVQLCLPAGSTEDINQNLQSLIGQKIAMVTYADVNFEYFPKDKEKPDFTQSSPFDSIEQGVEIVTYSGYHSIHWDCQICEFDLNLSKKDMEAEYTRDCLRPVTHSANWKAYISEVIVDAELVWHSVESETAQAEPLFYPQSLILKFKNNPDIVISAMAPTAEGFTKMANQIVVFFDLTLAKSSGAL